MSTQVFYRPNVLPVTRVKAVKDVKALNPTLTLSFFHPPSVYRVFQKTDPLVHFDDNLGKYGPILTIFSVLQQEIYEEQKLSYLSHLTFIMLPLYLAKQTLMLVSMQIFLDHASKQISMYSSG